MTTDTRAYTLRELIAAEEAGEVSDSALEKAFCRLAEWATEGPHWYEYTKDTWTEALAQVGFTSADIRFSGFWSQGDGASFTSHVDMSALLAFFTTPIEPENCIKPTRRTGDREDFWPWIVEKVGRVYNPQFTCVVPIADYLSPDVASRLASLVNNFEEACDELRRDLCCAIYKDLESGYEYCTSKEALIDDAEANGWQFDEEGDPIP